MALRRAVVVGGGQMGIATSLALCRSAWQTTLVLRDRLSCDTVNGDKQLRAFSPAQHFPLPANMRVVADDAAAVADAVQQAQVLLVCVPSSAVPGVAPLINQLPPTSPVIVCARGFTAKGDTPRDVLVSATSAALPLRRVVTSTGALFAKELASSSSAASSPPSPSPVTFGLSRRPFVAIDGGSNGAASALFATGAGVPRCFYVDPSQASDSTLPEHLAGLANGLSLVVSVGAGLVSNQYPGSVSAQFSYHLHSLHAVAYVLHAAAQRHGAGGGPATAAASTNATAESCLDASSSSSFPLHPLLASTVTAACFNLGSREFAYGRTLDFHFTQSNAMRSHFQRGSLHEQALRDTCDGVFSLLERLGVTSPFFTALCDACLCFHRGSVVGQHLVRVGEYAWLEALAQPSPAVGQMQVLDAAVLCDDTAAFIAAKARLEEVLSKPPPPVSC